jgi:arylsulfatase A-like enzyme
MANAALNYAQGVDAEHASEQMLNAKDPDFHKILDRLQNDPAYRALIVTDFTVTHRPYPAKRLDDFCREYPDECRPRQDAAAFDHYRNLFRSDHISFAYDFERAAQSHGLTETDVRNLTDVVEVLYKACVNRLDRSFGRIVAEIERRHLLPESVIVFTADHGEVLYRDNLDFKWCHAFQLAPEVLHVPLIIHAPAAGIDGGMYEGVTRSIDVLPTLAGLAKVPMPDYAGPGVDLSAAMRAKEPPPPLLAFSHSSLLPQSMAERLDELGHLRTLFPRRDPDLMWVAVRSEDSLYKLRPRDGRIVASVYDLAADPTETEDLYDPAAARQQAVLEQLSAYRVSLIEGYDVWERRPGELDEDERIRILRSLGYVR